MLTNKSLQIFYWPNQKNNNPCPGCQTMGFVSPCTTGPFVWCLINLHVLISIEIMTYDRKWKCHNVWQSHITAYWSTYIHTCHWTSMYMYQYLQQHKSTNTDNHYIWALAPASIYITKYWYWLPDYIVRRSICTSNLA